MPIAVNKYDKDLFFIDISETDNKGKVIWFVGETVEVWNNFKEYLFSIIQYNQRLLDKMQKEIFG